MHLRLWLILSSLMVFTVFIVFSYSVAKEAWQQIDFNMTVKIQDRVSRGYDEVFSYFSFLGSAEVTVGIIVILALLSLIRGKILSVVGWSLVVPATIVEVAGKLFIFHPSPPVLLQRSIIETHLPSFYIHTNFSYPSGHMTRTAFLLTVLTLCILFSKRHPLNKLILTGIFISLGCLMAFTRVYLGEHWLSDVLGGGLLGLSAGLFSSALIISKRVVKI